ncbi:MAG: S41 family peptidase [Acidimicrobiia bacterium]
MIRRPITAGMLALVVVACAPGGTVLPSSTTSTSSTTTAPPPPPIVLEVQPCPSAPPVTWQPLCRGFAIVDRWYVDPVDPPSLAAAAALGVAQAPMPEFRSAGRSARCLLPHESFVSVCDAIAARLRPGEDPSSYVDAAVDGMFVYGLDPFSWYLPAELAAQLGSGEAGAVVSMGMVVAAVDERGEPCSPIGGMCVLEVIGVWPAGPAEQAALVVGDELAAIDGRGLAGTSVPEATALLEGDRGEPAVLTVVRDGSRSHRTVMRNPVAPAAVEYGVLAGEIIYLKINEFTLEAAQAVGEVLQAEGGPTEARGVLLDLRDNPGGLVGSAVGVASQFLSGGEVVRQEDRTGVTALPVVEGGLAIDPGVQVVVIVNRASSSAAEIVAAVLQERGRATVVGERTFGKHLVQQTYELGDDAEIRLTVARWTTPGGRSVAGTGVAPDVTVSPIGDGDAALDEALRRLRE